ncbi:MAG: hypothetical protein R3237_04120 [Nitrosopumilaceae archaeon]|nr:hypothetical protein [Nitrosopumilaceae archaeon]
MNPKIFVIIAIVILGGVIGVIFTTTSVTESSEGLPVQEIQNPVEPLELSFEDLSILQVTDRAAILEIQIKLDNPNSRSVIANLVKYSLYASDDSEEFKIYAGEIGSRPEGMVDGSNYYTLLSNNSIILKDKITLTNPGNSPELMSMLNNPDTQWRVTGTVFFNLSSMTSGQENEVNFELTR